MTTIWSDHRNAERDPIGASCKSFHTLLITWLSYLECSFDRSPYRSQSMHTSCYNIFIRLSLVGLSYSKMRTLIGLLPSLTSYRTSAVVHNRNHGAPPNHNLPQMTTSLFLSSPPNYHYPVILASLAFSFRDNIHSPEMTVKTRYPSQHTPRYNYASLHIHQMIHLQVSRRSGVVFGSKDWCRLHSILNCFPPLS